VTDPRLADLLQAILDASADGLLVVDEGGRVLAANRRFQEIWRIPDDLLATGEDDRLLAFVLDQLQDPEGFLAKVRELYGTDREDFDTLRFSDGRVLERYSRPIVHGGVVAGRVWSFRDVTERRRAEAEVREAENRFRALVERIPAAVYVDAVDPSFRAGSRPIYMSPQIERILGYTAEEFLEDPDLWVNVLHPDDRDAALAADADFYSTGVSSGQVCRVIAKDGRIVWVHDWAAVEDDPAEGERIVRGVLLDVTERKEMEERVREAEERYRALVEQMPAVAYTWDSTTRLTSPPYLGPQAKALFGYSLEEWSADPKLWAHIIHPDDRARVLGESDRTGETGEPFDVEYRVIAADGRTVWVHDRCVVARRDNGGRPTIWHGVIVDITERKQAEEDRRAMHARIVRAQEQERRHVAEEIEDDALQKITAAGLRLHAARARRDEVDREQALDELQRIFDAAIGRLRRLQLELRPPSLDRQGLSIAIRQLLDAASTESPIRLSLEDRLEAQPPGEVALVAYRAVQSALQAAVAHAPGERLHVTLSQDGSETQVSFAAAEGTFDDRSRARSAVAAIIDRVRLAGGQVLISDGGAALVARLPAGVG
jgi:PAS domain S-box-containing protein